ncbi:MAG: hypothetical protein ACYSYM_11455, partial [Planctomycetota bacterium]
GVAFGDKTQPIQWLQNVAFCLVSLAGVWDEYDSDYVKDTFEHYQEQFPNMSKIEMYRGIAYSIRELLRNYYTESMSVINELSASDNKEYVLKEFEGSTVFASIVDAIGTLECVISEAEFPQNHFYYHQYYCIAPTPKDAEEWFGAEAAGRYRKNPKLTLRDYENAFEHIPGLLKKIEEGRFVQKLKESAGKIRAYCRLKAESPEKYIETEAAIAKRFDQAYRSYEYAEEQLIETGRAQKTVIDKQAYDYLREHGFKGADDYKLPDFPTWQRYVRGGRRKYGTQKNAPRASRRYGRNIVKSNQIQSLSEISFQYPEDDK